MDNSSGITAYRIECGFYKIFPLRFIVTLARVKSDLNILSNIKKSGSMKYLGAGLVSVIANFF